MNGGLDAPSVKDEEFSYLTAIALGAAYRQAADAGEVPSTVKRIRNGDARSSAGGTGDHDLFGTLREKHRAAWDRFADLNVPRAGHVDGLVGSGRLARAEARHESPRGPGPRRVVSKRRGS